MNRTPRFLKFLKENNGASSVLVIIMMVVLVILGLAIATTSISNRKLSDKKTKWLKSYYELSGEAQIKISEIDEAINSSRSTAKDEEGYAKEIAKNLKNTGVKVAMPYVVDKMSSCNISFEIKEEGSKFNKRLFVNMMVPLDLDYRGDIYQLTNYQLIQEPLVKEEEDEFMENPFENMN